LATQQQEPLVHRDHPTRLGDRRLPAQHRKDRASLQPPVAQAQEAKPLQPASDNVKVLAAHPVSELAVQVIRVDAGVLGVLGWERQAVQGGGGPPLGREKHQMQPAGRGDGPLGFVQRLDRGEPNLVGQWLVDQRDPAAVGLGIAQADADRSQLLLDLGADIGVTKLRHRRRADLPAQQQPAQVDDPHRRPPPTASIPSSST
jgi:hypothetical protein